MDDPAPELEAEAQELRQRAWVLGQFHQALRVNGIPDHLCDSIVAATWDNELDSETVAWRDLGEEN